VILQAELFNEIHRWTRRTAQNRARRHGQTAAAAITPWCAIFSKPPPVWGEGWGNSAYMITKPVALKAIDSGLRRLDRHRRRTGRSRVERWRNGYPWAEQAQEFRNGVYERFPARADRARLAHPQGIRPAGGINPRPSARAHPKKLTRFFE